jgi:hypothetical protein
VHVGHDKEARGSTQCALTEGSKGHTGLDSEGSWLRGVMAQCCNPSYMGSVDQEDCNLWPAQRKKVHENLSQQMSGIAVYPCHKSYTAKHT